MSNSFKDGVLKLGAADPYHWLCSAWFLSAITGLFPLIFRPISSVAELHLKKTWNPLEIPWLSQKETTWFMEHQLDEHQLDEQKGSSTSNNPSHSSKSTDIYKIPLKSHWNLIVRWFAKCLKKMESRCAPKQVSVKTMTYGATDQVKMAGSFARSCV